MKSIWLVMLGKQAIPKIAPSILVASTLQLLFLCAVVWEENFHPELLIRIFFLFPLGGDERLAPASSDLALCFVVRKKLGL